MSDSYMSGIPGYNNNASSSDQQNELFKTLMQQTMKSQGSSASPYSPILQGLSTYLMMQGQQPQVSTDPTSASFMGPPTSMMQGFGGS